MTYAQRYIAFVDILGFRELIRKSEREPELIEAIRSTINEVHKAEPGDGYVIVGDDMRSQSISDAVAISTADNGNGLYKMLHSVQMMQWRLLERGILIRGAIVKGAILHDNHVIFGPGFNEAYRLESTIAKYPRIMVARQVAKDIEQTQRAAELLSYIKRDDDGPVSVNVLRGLDASSSEEQRAHFLPQLQGMARLLKIRLEEQTDAPAHFEKIQWFARDWNSLIPSWANGCRVEGPGLTEMASKADAIGLALIL